MQPYVKLYSSNPNEIENFLNLFFKDSTQENKKNVEESFDSSTLEWQKKYENPIEIADIIGTFIENNDKFKLNMWISLDNDVLINVTPLNADDIIRYLYERFPY